MTNNAYLGVPHNPSKLDYDAKFVDIGPKNSALIVVDTSLEVYWSTEYRYDYRFLKICEFGGMNPKNFLPKTYF